MPYLYQFGYYHPGIYTLECSRSGAGALAAYANMRLLGKEGYRILIGHVVEMAEMLRKGAKMLSMSCPECGTPARLGSKILGDGRKVRICRKCQGVVDK